MQSAGAPPEWWETKAPFASSRRVAARARVKVVRYEPLKGIRTQAQRLAWMPDPKIGLRKRSSPMCTLSQNGYGDSHAGFMLVAL